MEKKMSLLIVDDDQGMTETLSDIFEEKGYSVDIAGNGSQAIELMKKKKFNIALMDIKMPGINGVETFKVVKEISPSTKVIMMTAYSVEGLIKEALDEGAFSVLYKPLDIDRVLSIIEKAEQGILILLVDDDPSFSETLKDILAERGYRVRVVNTGEEAIKRVQENGFEIIFIDMKMPVLNGLETFKEIKKINPKIVVVIVTGYSQENQELIEEALNNEAYTCLHKPLDMDKVLALVEEICRKKWEVL